jgi:hypothetical protein
MSKRDRAESADAEYRVEFTEPEFSTEEAPKPEPVAEPAPSAPVAKRVARPGFMLVATNPFSALDHLGRPCGACPVDPFDPRYYDKRKPKVTFRGNVGAARVAGEVTRPAARLAELRQQTERTDIEWAFVREPFEIPETSFYKRQIAEGTLLDANNDYERARANARARSKCAVEPRWT